MAKKQIEPAQGCEEIINIEGVIFACDDERKGHITPHSSQRKIGDQNSPGGFHIMYIITWRKVPNIVVSSQN